MLAQSLSSGHALDASTAHLPSPKVSVVLLVSATGPAAASRIPAAVSICREHGAELLVAWTGARTGMRTLEGAFPSVRFVTEEAEHGDERSLRMRAGAMARGDLVCVIPADQALDESWFARRMRGDARGVRAGEPA